MNKTDVNFTVAAVAVTAFAVSWLGVVRQDSQPAAVAPSAQTEVASSAATTGLTGDIMTAGQGLIPAPAPTKAVIPVRKSRAS